MSIPNDVVTKLNATQIKSAQVKQIDSSMQSRLLSLDLDHNNLNIQLGAKQTLLLVYHPIQKDLIDANSLMVKSLQSKIDSSTNVEAAFSGYCRPTRISCYR